ncbi:hypothetical protein [Bdellovibrio sp. BCCA]|uniref:hypothetical protein n=1 Tax=Bdellovibrio sp. BCCA TaxID=3136281 RepID=UPI0030F08DB2
MKTVLLALMMLFSVSSHADDKLYIKDLDSEGAYQWKQLPPEVRRAILHESWAYENTTRLEATPAKRIVVVTPSHESVQPVRVFGFTEQDVLNADGDPHGQACSNKHNQGDLSNRWCHAYFVKLTDNYLRSKGVNRHLSAVLSASIFIPKEYGYDLHPSPSDLVMAEYEIYSKVQTRRSTRMTVTAFGDKAVFFTLEKRF